MTKSAYKYLEDAFYNVKAVAVIRNGEMVAKIIVKGKSAFVHWIGKPMQKATVRGCGYNIAVAAISAAAEKIETHSKASGVGIGVTEQAFLEALKEDQSGHDWDRRLRNAGFIVASVI